jgi:uncharacterized protein DUF6983
MMLQVPLSPIPAQTLSVVLGGQACQIAVYQRRTGLFFDLLLNGVAVVTTVLCQNWAPLLTQTYQGFAGTFAFLDTQGDTAPMYPGLGSRYQLMYLVASDFAS